MAGVSEEGDCITADEIQKLGEALKDDKFRKMFMEYAEEMNDPENREKYEEELKVFEKERGMDITFIYPENNYVMKTKIADGSKKVFINICTNKHVEKPSCSRADSSGTPGLNWNIPYFLSKPQEDTDKAGKPCTVYDVVFHADTLYMSQKNDRFRKIVEQTALDGIESKFNIKLKSNFIHYPKMKYKGKPIPSIIRKKLEKQNSFNNSEPVDSNITQHDYYSSNQAPSSNDYVEENEAIVLQPKYTIKHRTSLTMEDYTIMSMNSPNTRPKELAISIELPKLHSLNNVELDVQEKSLSLVSYEKVSYKLLLDLPYPVYLEKGTAKFDSDGKVLNVVIPVIPFVEDKPHIKSENEEILNDKENCQEEKEKAINESGNMSEKQIFNEKDIQVLENSKCLNLPNFDSKYQDEGYTLVEDVICNQSEEAIAVILYLQNLDPSFVKTEVDDSKKSIFLIACRPDAKFCFGLKLSGDIVIEEPKLDVTKHNVILSIKKTKKICYSGKILFLNENGWQAQEFPNANTLMNTHLKFKENNEILLTSSVPLDNTQVTVKDISENSVTIQVQMSDHKFKKPERPKNFDGLENISQNYYAKFKQRTSSESSEMSEDMSPMRRYRGILKNSANWRSISESSDDYAWMSHDLASPESDFGSCESDKPKKSVRFSDYISKTIFKANASILGQKKKNQKRNLNKKKNAAKKGKYSGTSGSESEGMSGTSDVEAGEEIEPESQQLLSAESYVTNLDKNDDISAIKLEDNENQSPKLSSSPIVKICKNVKMDANEKFEKLDFRTSKNRVHGFDNNPDFRTNPPRDNNHQKPKRGKKNSRNRKSKSSLKSDILSGSLENGAQSESLSEENNDSDTQFSGLMFQLD